MRLKDYEIRAIKDAIHQYDEDARVYLFGSRADDSKKGGDIDLLVISGKLTYNDKLRIRQAIEEKIGERKIDIVITGDMQLPFVRVSMSEGVLL